MSQTLRVTGGKALKVREAWLVAISEVRVGGGPVNEVSQQRGGRQGRVTVSKAAAAVRREVGGVAVGEVKKTRVAGVR